MQHDYPFGMLPTAQASVEVNARIFSEIPDHNTSIVEILGKLNGPTVLRNATSFLRTYQNGKFLLSLIDVARNIRNGTLPIQEDLTEPTPKPFIALETLTEHGDRNTIAEFTNDVTDPFGNIVVTEDIFNEMKALCQLSNGELI